MLSLRTAKWSPGPGLPHEMGWAVSVQVEGSMFILGGEHIGYCSKQHLYYASDSVLKFNVEDGAFHNLI